MTPSAITQEALESKLWDAANALRGPVDPSDFKSYVFPVLFFKWISDTWDLEHEQAVNEVGMDILPEEEADYHRFVVPLVETYDQWRAEWPQLVSGHAICGSISWYARRILGRTVSREHIETAFRIAYQKSHLSASRLGARMRMWCTTNNRVILV